MPNATRDAARKGYELFISNASTPSRDRLNQLLANEGQPPISERTYKHYKALRTRGVRRYVPINRFDVDRARGTLG
jgi:hypothetical protein